MPTKPPLQKPWAGEASELNVVDPGEEFVGLGFQESRVPPPRQILNWILRYCSNGVRYLCRRGVPDYEAHEAYQTGDIVRAADGGLYESINDLNTNVAPGSRLSPWGALSLFGRTEQEIQAGITPGNLRHPMLNILRYGADPSGIEPSDDAIRQAIAVAGCKLLGEVNGNSIHLPTGRYLINRTIDLTNSRLPNTRALDGVRVSGDSAGGTVLIGRTGIGQPVVETTGSQWLSIENLSIICGGAGASTVAIFQGISTVLAETQNQRFSKLVIDMGDYPSANGGAGSVGIWNFGAEENTYQDLWVRANLPVILTAHNPSPATRFKTPKSYQPLASVHSLGMTTFSGETALLSLNRRQPSLTTEDVNSLALGAVYFANTGDGGDNETAWRAHGIVAGAKHSGIVEGHSRYLEVTGAVANLQAAVTFGGCHAPSCERVLLVQGVAGKVQNSDFVFQDNVNPDRALLALSPSSSGGPGTSAVTNTRFKLNCDARFVSIPVGVLANKETANVEVLCCGKQTPHRFTVFSNRSQEIDIDHHAAADIEVILAVILLPEAPDPSVNLNIALTVQGMLNVPSRQQDPLQFIELNFVLSLNRPIVPKPIALRAGTRLIAALRLEPGDSSTNHVKKLTCFVQADSRDMLYSPSRVDMSFIGSARMYWQGASLEAPRLGRPA